ncbi:MAG: signal peptidase I [Thermoplasmata archaeon]
MPGLGPPGTAVPLSAKERRIHRWGHRRVVVRDESMVPTLLPGDRLRVDTRAFMTEPPRIGDLVVLVDPVEPSRWLVKRVAAIGPAELWRTRTGTRARSSPSTNEGDTPADVVEEIALPTGTIYVVSDGTGPTRDSRSFGPVPQTDLIGRVYARYYPPGRRGAL